MRSTLGIVDDSWVSRVRHLVHRGYKTDEGGKELGSPIACLYPLTDPGRLLCGGKMRNVRDHGEKLSIHCRRGQLAILS